MNGESCGTNWRQHGMALLWDTISLLMALTHRFNAFDDNCTAVLAKINTMRTNPEDFL